MTRQCLNRRKGSIENLRKELRLWNDDYNKDPSPIHWQFQTSDSRMKLKSLYPDIDKTRVERDKLRKAKAE